MTMAEIDGLREVADKATENLRRAVAEAEACERCGGDGRSVYAAARIRTAQAVKDDAERAVIIALRRYWAAQEDADATR